MSRSFAERKRFRKTFGKIPEIAPVPNLIEVQRTSYESFLQMYTPPADRKDFGLQTVLRSVFPIIDFSGRAQLEFVRYELGSPKYDVEECRQRDMTYAAPLKVTLRLVVWDLDADTGARSVRDIKEQDVYLGDVPLMTETGTFVINGTERVIVSQMHRSPGVFFDHDDGKTHASGKFLFAARVIPYRGSWLDIEFDPRDLIQARIDRKRKILVTTFLMCLDSEESLALREAAAKKGETIAEELITGMSREEILAYFYDTIPYTRAKKSAQGTWKLPFNPEHWKGIKLEEDLINAETNEILVKAGNKILPRQAKKMEEDGLQFILASQKSLYGKYCARDLINENSGEVYLEAGDEIDEKNLELLEENKINEIPILATDNVNLGAYLRNTLAADKNNSRQEALLDVYRVMRPGEPPTLEGAAQLFKNLFFDVDRYDLSSVGRVKMNGRLGFQTEDSLRVLRKEDILSILRILIDLKDGKGEIDDIDNLANRRVRSVGELLENQFRLGLVRMERSVKERMSSVDIDTVMPHDLINAKAVVSSIREFFGSSQLSQFMDQTNPLSEITHKRRLSALGPGGLTRDRAGFEVRDVHPTHYGRICPIETPEGPNIGLINSLATYARINKYGFIETPYRTVVSGKVTNEIIHLSAMEEINHNIGQANISMDKANKLLDGQVMVRRNGEFVVVPAEEIEYIDISPKQLVSVAASLIPFLENDDASRALMGSNMQRQAVPLIQVEAPLIGTGMEGPVARDSGATVIARRAGVVDQVDATRIVVQATEKSEGNTPTVDIYNLHKFQRSNHSTCITQKPLVRVGDHVEKGDIIGDGPSTELGELALGRNVLVAFMPWSGYNFEDSIIISERIVSEDVFTSIHIEEFEIMARDTKLGNEEITRDIPNVGDDALQDLDEAGIVYVGAEVQPGDILVGKVTPKGESPMTPEEKLLKAIFGEKATDVRDTSLRVPPGTGGTVVAVRVFSRRGIEKDERSIALEWEEVEKLSQDREAEKAILERSFYSKLKELIQGHKVVNGPKSVAKGAVVTQELLDLLTKGQWRQLNVANEDIMAQVEAISKQHDSSIDKLEHRFNDKVEKIRQGDELSPGVMKMVKVFVAVKRKLQPGDKMAGRHGNKGVVSRIVPVEDMPYLEDGRAVDIILNPLGVPSRMNVGQVLETHLGWASSGLGRQVASLLKETSDPAQVKKFLKTIYSSSEDHKDLDALSDSGLMEMAENLRSGIPMATPVFDGAHESDVVEALVQAGLNSSGQCFLTDGRTGERFQRPVTVGTIYMLKLHHLVDDKIHARSVGPYSLVTQQPLGGKAQFGGQRFGEMEVWALQAYGAAYTLQEMLTIKSDDVIGRTKVYESLVRGEDSFNPGTPESFNVLLKEIKSLGLDVEFGASKKSQEEL